MTLKKIAFFLFIVATAACSKPDAITDKGSDNTDFDTMVVEQTWSTDQVLDDAGIEIGTIYSNLHMTDIQTCKQWVDKIVGTDLLPTRIRYFATTSGGRPAFYFDTTNRTNLLTSHARNFALTLGAFGEEQSPKWGSTSITHSSDLLCLDSSSEDLSCEGMDSPMLFWWGRQSTDPWVVTEYPFTAITDEYDHFETKLDLFKWNDGQEKHREQASCVLRLFDLPGGNKMPSFKPSTRLIDNPKHSTAENRCIYQTPFNPFVNQDLVTPNVVKPSTFGDANAGLNRQCQNICTEAQLAPPTAEDQHLSPRIQLIAPMLKSVNRFHKVEAFCNLNPQVCNSLDNSQSLDQFTQYLGLTPNSPLAEIITNRQRNHVPWRHLDGDGGMWQKPRTKAGFELPRISLLIKNEGPSSFVANDGTTFDTVFCNPDSVKGSVRLAYKDRFGVLHRTEPVVMNCLPCNHHALDDTLIAAYRGDHAQYCPALYGIDENEGVLFKTPNMISVPPLAIGAAHLEFSGILSANNGDKQIEFEVARSFPIYIDGAQTTSVISKAACWIGASNWMPTINGFEQIDVIPNAFYNYVNNFLVDEIRTPDTTLEKQNEIIDRYLSATRWLQAGDVNRWFKKKTQNQAKLYTLAGDVQLSDEVDWFDYRGSTISFSSQMNDFGTIEWIDSNDGVSKGTSCPAMKPLLLDSGLPLEMVRSSGQNHENALPQTKSEGSIFFDHCQETGKETTAPVSGFQFADQEQSGDAYVWFYVGRDWGWVSKSAAANDGQEAEKGVDIMSKARLTMRTHDYNNQHQPWGSFIGHWGKNGIDDMSRSVSWDCTGDSNNDGKCDKNDTGTKFVNTAPLVVRNLGASIHLDDAVFDQAPSDFDKNSLDGQEGLLVWHSGCYRCSMLFLSFVKKEDVLDPSKYWHYAGGQQHPVWTRNELAANPVIWDTFGEFSLMDLSKRNASADCSSRTIFSDFVIIYPLVEQRGIIMREAQMPWGPYSEAIPLYGNTENDKSFDEAMKAIQGQVPLAAYSGYSHVDLWGKSICQGDTPQSTKVRFNVSLWTPYKTVLVESDVTR